MADSAIERARLVGLSANDLARGAGVDPHTVKRSTEGQGLIATAQRIERVLRERELAVLGKLCQRYPAEAVKFLRGPELQEAAA